MPDFPKNSSSKQDEILSFFVDVKLDPKQLREGVAKTVADIKKVEKEISAFSKAVAQANPKIFDSKSEAKNAKDVEKIIRQLYAASVKAENDRARRIRQVRKELIAQEEKDKKEQIKAMEWERKEREKAYKERLRQIKEVNRLKRKAEEDNIRGLQRELQALKTFAKASAAITAAGAASIIAPTKRAGDFEAEMQRFKAVSTDPNKSAAANEESFNKFSKKALELASNSKFMTFEVAEAGNIMGKLGLSTDEATDALQGIILTAEASGESIDKIAQIVVGVKNGFGLLATDATHIADVLAHSVTNSANTFETLGTAMKYVAPVARGSGQSLEDVTGILNIMGNNMVLGSTAGTSFRQSLIRLAKMTPETKEMLSSLNVEVQDSQNNFRRMPDILLDLAKSLDGAGETMKTMALSTIFGERAVTGMMAVIEDTDGLKKLKAGIEGINGSAERMKKIAFQGLNAELIKLTSAFDSFMVEIGMKFLPLVKMGISVLLSFVTMLSNMSDAAKTVGASILIIGTALSGLFTILLTVKIAMTSYTLAVASLDFAAKTATLSNTALGASMLSLRTAIMGVGRAFSFLLGPWGMLIAALSLAVPVLWNVFDAKVKLREESEKEKKMIDGQIERSDKLSLATGRLIEKKMQLAELERKLNSGEISKEEFEKASKETSRSYDLFEDATGSSLTEGLKNEIDLIDKEMKRLPEKIEEMKKELSSIEKIGWGDILGGSISREQENKRIQEIEDYIARAEEKIKSGSKRLAFAQRDLATSEQLDILNDKKKDSKQKIVAMMVDLNNSLDNKQISELHKDISEETDRLKKTEIERLHAEYELKGIKLDNVELTKREEKAVAGVLKETDKIFETTLNTLETNGERDKLLKAHLEKLQKERELLQANLDIELTQLKIAKERLRTQTLMGEEISAHDLGSHEEHFDNSGGVKFGGVNKQAVTSGYGYRIHPVFRTSRLHAGIDQALPQGTPVKSDAEGKIAYSGHVKGYGNTVVVDIGGGNFILYAHNSKLYKQVGQAVKKGETISLSGGAKGTYGAGTSTGPHLHTEFRRGGKEGSTIWGTFGTAFNPTEGFKGSKFTAQIGSKQTSLNVNKINLDLKNIEQLERSSKLEDAIMPDMLKMYDEITSKEDELLNIKDLENSLKVAEKKLLDAQQLMKTNQSKRPTSGETPKAISDLIKTSEDDYKKALSEKLKIELQLIRAKNKGKEDELKKDAEIIKKRVSFGRELEELEMSLNKQQLDIEGKKKEAVNANHKIEMNNIKKKYNDMAKKASEFVTSDKQAQDVISKLKKFKEKEEFLAIKKRNEEIAAIEFDSFKKTFDLKKTLAEFNQNDFQRQKQLLELNYELRKRSIDNEIRLENDNTRKKLLNQIKDAEAIKHKSDMLKLIYDQEEKEIALRRSILELNEKNNELLSEAGSLVAIATKEDEKGLKSLFEKYKSYKDRFKDASPIPSQRDIDKAVDHLEKKLANASETTDILSSKAAREEDPIKRRELEIEYLKSLEEERKLRETINQLNSESFKLIRNLAEEQKLFNKQVDGAKSTFLNIGTIIGSIFGSESAQLFNDIGNNIDNLQSKFNELIKIMDPLDKDLFANLNMNLKRTFDDIGGKIKDSNGISGLFGSIFNDEKLMALVGGFVQAFSAVLAGTKLIADAASKLGAEFFGFLFGAGQIKHKEWELELQKRDAELFKKRNEFAFKNGDISESLYNKNKLKAIADEYINKVQEIDLELEKKRADVGKNLGASLLGGLFGGGIFNKENMDKLLESQIEEAKAKAEAKRKKEDADLELQMKLRQENLDQEKQAIENYQNLVEQKDKIKQKELEISGDTIGLIKHEAEARKNATIKRLEQSRLEREQNGNTEYERQRHNNVVSEITLERIQIEKEEYQKILEYRTKLADLDRETELSKISRDTSITDFEKKRRENKINFDKEFNSLTNTMKTTDDIEIYKRTLAKRIELTNSYNEQQNMSMMEEFKYFDQITRKMYLSFAELNNNKVEIARWSLDQRLADFDDETKVESRKLQANSDAYNEYIKGREAERKRIVKDTNTELQKIFNDDLRFEHEAKVSSAKNTYDKMDDVIADFDARRSDISQQLLIEIANNENKKVELTEEANKKILALEIEKFEKMAQIQKEKLQERFEVGVMSAELKGDPLSIFGADRQNFFEELFFDEQIKLKQMKAMNASQKEIDKMIAKFELKRKLRNKKDLEDLKNAEVNRYEQILNVRERIYEIDKRQFELEIKKRQREIDDLEKKIDKLNREKDAIERKADEEKRKFNIADRKEFDSLFLKYEPNQEIMDALEFISNPTLNEVDDATSQTAIDGLRERLDIQKQLLENSYMLEDITGEQYYSDLENLLGGAAAGASQALKTLLVEQQNQIQNLQDIGKNEDEIRVVRKSQMKQTAEMQRFIAELYQQFQDNRIQQIDELKQKELDAKDDLIRAEEDKVRDLEAKNLQAQESIDKLTQAYEKDTDLIRENIDEVKDSMDTFGISINSVRNNLTGLLEGTKDKFAEFKASMKNAFDMSFINELLSSLNIDNVGVNSQYSNYQTARIDKTDYSFRDSDGVKLADIPTRSRYISPEERDPDGAFTIEGNDGTWFRTGSEMDLYYNTKKAIGARFGMTPEAGVGGSFDYIPAMLRPNEVVAPIKDFKHLVRALTYQNMFANHRMAPTSSQNVYQIRIDKVYGELNLDRAIQDGIRKANMEDGYHNAIYAINSN